MVQKFGKHGCITNVTTSDFDRPHFKRLLIDANVYLMPNVALEVFMPACVLLALIFSLDACAVDKKVQWTCRTTIRKALVQCLLAAT